MWRGSRTTVSSFDLQLFPAQMKDGLQLVGENPETNFILTHAGMLTDLTPDTVEAWKAACARSPQAPNLYAKLSGLGTFVHRNDPDADRARSSTTRSTSSAATG